VKIYKFLVEKEDIISAEALIDTKLKKAINIAFKNIYDFHMRQKPVDLDKKETSA